MTNGPEVLRCARHPEVETSLRCGKCRTPICPRCMVQTPVGARCPDCARLSKLPTYRLSNAHYLRATAAALGIAIAIGAVWGVIESFLPFRFFSLIIGAGIGYAIGEVVSLAVNRKRGTPLAVIGALAVVLCYGITWVVDYYMTGFFIFSTSRLVFTVLAIGIGGYVTVTRLR